MPIVTEVAENSELTQGDILRDVPFLVVDPDGKAQFDRDAHYVLVVSRPCKALREGLVVVAPVVPYIVDLAEFAKTAPSPVGSLDRTRRFLAGLRDGINGDDFSDALYLGTVEQAGTKRFAAQLTSLCTARVPEGTDERRAWIRARRVGRLGADFLRDLHTRLLLTFTRLGFDDYEWYPDADLAVMISAGEAELHHLRAESTAAEQAIQQQEAANRTVAKAQKEALEKKRGAVVEAELKLRPFLDERGRRQQE
jgi:hypothetical protein